jgi:Matrixin
MIAPLFCCQAKHLPLPEQVCQWPVKQITWYQTVKLSQIDSDTTAQTYRAVWQAWADVCGIEPEEQEVASANCQAFNGDGPANGFDLQDTILALTELPCGATPDTCLHQVVNDHEQWTPEFLRLVLLHEIGHFLGLGHSTDPEDIMYPYYNPALRGLSPGDIAQGVARYGPPVKDLPTASQPSGPDSGAGTAQDQSFDLTVEQAGPVTFNLTLDFPEAGTYQIDVSYSRKGD